MAARQLLFEIGDRAAGRFQQHEQMVDQIRRLVNHRAAIARHRFNNRFDGLLAHFLRDLVHAGIEEFRRIGAFGHRGVTAADDRLQITDEPLGLRHGRTETALRARMAGRAVRNHTDQQRIGIAVNGHRDDFEPVAARLALRPETLPRAAVEGHAPFGKALFISLAVHVSEHQHLQGPVVLNDGRHESVGLLLDGEFGKGFCFDFHVV